MRRLAIEQFRAVVFDYDGVLGDTHPLHNPARDMAFEHMFAMTGDQRFKDVPREVHEEAHKHGSNPVTIIGWVLQQQGIIGPDIDFYEDPTVARVVRYKNHAYTQLAAAGADAMPGAIEFVRKAYDIFQCLGIGTTSRREEDINPFLRRHDLEGLFDNHAIATLEDVSEPKPDPEVYELLLGRLGLQDNPRSMLVIEDSAHGIEAARSAGSTVVGVATTRTVEELEGLAIHRSPDIIVPNFFTLIGMIEAA